MSAVDSLPQGAPYAIGQALVQALVQAFEGQDVKVLDNPVRASLLNEGSKLVIFEDQADKFDRQPGQQQYRTYAFSVAVICRTQAARQDAHSTYRAVKRVVRSSLPGINVIVSLASRGLLEGDVTYRLENIDVGGGLVLGAFTVDYRDPG
jgi:hypothetical protein